MLENLDLPCLHFSDFTRYVVSKLPMIYRLTFWVRIFKNLENLNFDKTSEYLLSQCGILISLINKYLGLNKHSFANKRSKKSG